MQQKSKAQALRRELVALVSLVVLAGALGCNNGGEMALPDTNKVSEKPNKGGGAQGSKAPPAPTVSDIPDTIYPDLPVGLLNAREREALVQVTRSQLCPCPKSSISMHECLQKQETQCALASSAALTVMQKIKEGFGEKDALDALGVYIESAYKKHDLDLEGVAHMGDPSAPVVIVEFADFECPFCNMARVIVKEVMKAHEGKVVVYFKQFPLGSHQHAFSASCAVLAAQKQGKFWPMYDLVFDNQATLSEDKIRNLAQALGLNMDQFLKDWKAAETVARVEKEKKEGVEVQVDSTPTFFINGRKFLGDKTPDALIQAVADELKTVNGKQ